MFSSLRIRILDPFFKILYTSDPGEGPFIIKTFSKEIIPYLSIILKFIINKKNILVTNIKYGFCLASLVFVLKN